jgi:hypothetical protein
VGQTTKIHALTDVLGRSGVLYDADWLRIVLRDKGIHPSSREHC